MTQFLSFLIKSISYSRQYQYIRRNPSKKASSFRFAVHVIIASILLVAFTGIFYLGLTLITEGTAQGFILGFIPFIAGASGAPVLFLQGIIFNIYQFSLNRRAIAWVALVIYFAATIFSIIILFTLLNGLK